MFWYARLADSYSPTNIRCRSFTINLRASQHSTQRTTHSTQRHSRHQLVHVLPHERHALRVHVRAPHHLRQAHCVRARSASRNQQREISTRRRHPATHRACAAGAPPRTPRSSPSPAPTPPPVPSRTASGSPRTAAARTGTTGSRPAPGQSTSVAPRRSSAAASPAP